MGKISDQEFLVHCIDTYQNLIFSICYKFTGNYFDAQDLTQDTFLSAYKNFARFDGRNEKSWLCRIAANKCLDYKKRAAARQIPTEETYFQELEANQESTENICLQDMVREELKICCGALKPPYDEIATYYFYDEMSVGEIAEKLDRNEKTVQTQVYRAKAMLRKLYEKMPIGRKQERSDAV